jgi:hypothetical protein
MNGKLCQLKRSYPNLRYYHDICSEGLKKTKKNLNQDSRYRERDSNRAPLQFKSRTLQLKGTFSVEVVKEHSHESPWHIILHLLYLRRRLIVIQ